MNKKLWVISLGGSRIVPDEVDEAFLKRFRKMVLKHPEHKFVVITGGGSTARKYITALRGLDKSTMEQSLAGIAVTRFHARFMAQFFGKISNEDEIPLNMKKIEGLLLKNRIVFAGALRYRPDNTSDGTAASVAAHLNCPFINLTNVKGLYSSNPKKNRTAKFISKITWKKFDAIASGMSFEAGQHFVLDQNAAKIIKKKKIATYIVGSVKSIEEIIRTNGKKFNGTLIAS